MEVGILMNLSVLNEDNSMELQYTNNKPNTIWKNKKGSLNERKNVPDRNTLNLLSQQLL